MNRFVAPSILSGDFANMEKSCKNAKQWGADILHLDVMDGVFVPNITFGMPMVKALKKCDILPLDVHLMITKPEKYVSQFCDCGADIVTFHPDASDDVAGALKTIKDKGVKCGLVLNPDKPLELVKPYIDCIDVLLIMSVYAGFGGQKFIPESLDKLVEAKKMIEGKNILLEVDGGVDESNVDAILNCGVDIMVAGSAVYKSDNPSRTIKILRGEK